MATLSARNPTLLDLAKATDPNMQIATIVEILEETNEILLDMTWVEGNLPTGHRTSIRTGLPTPTWRKLYGGVQPNKGTIVQVTDNTGMLWAYSEIDKKLAELNGNTAAFRLTEDSAHIEGMNIELAATLFAGDEATEPEAFTGFGPRFDDLSGPANADNIIDGAGTGTDNASIWLVVWHPTTVHGIVPKGSTAGLQMTDKGLVTIEDASDGSNTGRMEAYRTLYEWDAGLTVRDWRYVVRIPNIDKSALTIDVSGSSADLSDLMFQAIDLIPNLARGRPAFYMNRTIRTMLRRQTADKVKQSTLEISKVGGVPLMSFHGVPCRRCDALAGDEARVV